MKWFAIFIMLAFYGLAFSTIGGILTSGYTVSLAITTAVLEVTIGIIIARAMLRSTIQSKGHKP